MPVGGLLPLREANRVTFGPKTRTVISRMNEGDMDVRPGAGRTKPAPGPLGSQSCLPERWRSACG